MSVVPLQRKGPAEAGPLIANQAEIEEVRAWLNDHKHTTGYSWKTLADKIGSVAESSLNLFATHKYTADESVIAGKIAAYRDMVEVRNDIGGVAEYVQTSFAKKMEEAMYAAEMLPGYAVIAGGSGLGKSRVMSEFRLARKNNSAYCKLSPDCYAVNGLLTELLFALTRRNVSIGRSSHMRRQVVELLKRRPLYVDEAQFLNEAGLDTLRAICDESPLILAGNERTYEGKSGTETPAYMQFTSRIVARVFQSADTVTEADVQMIALQLAKKDFVSRNLDLLVEQARAGGAFRTVDKLIKRAFLNAQATKEEPQRKHLLAAIAAMRHLPSRVGAPVK